MQAVEYKTTDEIAKWLKCSPRHVRRLKHRGLPFQKIGGLLRFNLPDVQRWIKRGGARG